MKKLLTGLILLLCVTEMTNAQKFDAGIMGGLSTTQISGDQLSGFDKVGLIFGGFVFTRLSDKFDASMQIMFIQKGSRKNATAKSLDSYLLRLSYIEVPVMFHWMYTEKFWFEAGPTFGVLLSEYEEDQLGELPQRRPFNDFELGLAGGLNVKLVDNLIFNARFSSSILPVREHQSGETYRLNKGQYNSVLAFTLLYQFSDYRSQ